MKKIYLLITLIGFISASSFAQQRIAKENPVNFHSIQNFPKQVPVQPFGVVDTLTNHWDIIFPFPSVDTAVTYSDQGGGYVAGHNSYSDIAKCQKFDAAYGVTSGGTITNLLLWFGEKNMTTGAASITPTIWDDNAGVPGTVLGTGLPVTVAQIDTSAMALGVIGTAAAVEGLYNINATFATPIAIPSNQIFWAGFTLNYAAGGDSVGLVTSSDGNFTDAATHTFEQWSDNSFHSFNDGTSNTWQLDVALAVYPVVDLVVTGINEHTNNVSSLSTIPNPAKDMTTINYEIKNASDVSVFVYDIAGKEILSLNQGMQQAGKHNLKLDVSAISPGIYFYTVSAGEYKATSKMTVVE